MQEKVITQILQKLPGKSISQINSDGYNVTTCQKKGKKVSRIIFDIITRFYSFLCEHHLTFVGGKKQSLQLLSMN